MALYKIMTLNNGIEVTYHRISNIKLITNNEIHIEITSYLSEEGRQDELRWYDEAAIRNELAAKEDRTVEEDILLSTPQAPMSVFTIPIYISHPYDETFNIKSAYAYLKTLPEFEGALDV